MLPISFEFYPPKTDEQRAQFDRTVRRLQAHAPQFMSVTFGAGGSTLSQTPETVQRLREDHGIDGVPHLTCVGGSRDEIRDLLHRYRALGCNRIVALRGDLPSGMAETGEFRYANELVEFIRAETGDWFSLEVAAYPEWHPQARSPKDDLAAFVKKVKAGANSAITQYFYNADAYFHFVDEARAAGVDIPIVPGIMPIASFSKLARFSDACGADIPRWMRKKFESFGDDSDSIKAFGLDVVTELCERLLKGGAPGLHFYCMNQAALTTEICRRLT